MARYIKANPKVVEFLNLKNDRNTVMDGNYILWQSDLLAFGPLTRLPETLAAIGAIALMPHEAREEQDGTNLRPLPVATDPRFIVPAPAETETPIEVPGTEGEAPETPAEPIEGENPGEATEQPNDDTPAEGDGETGTADTDTVEPETNTTKRTTKKATV